MSHSTKKKQSDKGKCIICKIYVKTMATNKFKIIDKNRKAAETLGK